MIVEHGRWIEGLVTRFYKVCHNEFRVLLCMILRQQTNEICIEICPPHSLQRAHLG